MLKLPSSLGLIFAASILCANAIAQTPDPAPSHADAGAHLFKQSCSACHSTVADQKIVGPSLHHELKGNPPKKTPAQVKLIIQNGNGTMPSFKALFTPADLDNLVAYLETQ